MRAYEIIREDEQLNEFFPAFLLGLELAPEVLAALATGVRVAAPYVGRALWGATKFAVKNMPFKKTIGLGGTEYLDQKYNNGDATKWVGKQAYDYALPPGTDNRQAADTVVDAVNTALKTAKTTGNLVKDTVAAGEVAAKDAWSSVKEAYDDIAKIVGDNLSPEAIQQLSNFSVKVALPIAAVLAILYGGEMLYNYMMKSADTKPAPPAPSA
jgi:hypothetical protein